jgi:hypothetical protein
MKGGKPRLKWLEDVKNDLQELEVNTKTEEEHL